MQTGGGEKKRETEKQEEQQAERMKAVRTKEGTERE